MIRQAVWELLVWPKVDVSEIWPGTKPPYALYSCTEHVGQLVLDLVPVLPDIMARRNKDPRRYCFVCMAEAGIDETPLQKRN